jgi:hypothetical protein
VKRRSGLAASLLFVGLLLGRTALAESETASLAAGALAAAVACLAVGLFWGIVAPDAVPDRELSPIARRAFVALLLVGGAALLLLTVLQSV